MDPLPQDEVIIIRGPYLGMGANIYIYIVVLYKYIYKKQVSVQDKKKNQCTNKKHVYLKNRQ